MMNESEDVKSGLDAMECSDHIQLPTSYVKNLKNIVEDQGIPMLFRVPYGFTKSITLVRYLEGESDIKCAVYMFF
jgi:hypothetical protein